MAPIATRWDVLLRVVGDFEIRAGDRTLYSETEFPVVEFAVQLAKWLARPGPDAGDLVYTSLESEVEGLIRFARVASDEWWLTALPLTEDPPRTFSTDEVRGAGLRFLIDLRTVLEGRVELLEYIGDAVVRTAVIQGYLPGGEFSDGPGMGP